MKNLVWSSAFIRTFKRLVRQNPPLRSAIEETLPQLAENPFNPSLRSHKFKIVGSAIPEGIALRIANSCGYYNNT